MCRAVDMGNGQGLQEDRCLLLKPKGLADRWGCLDCCLSESMVHFRGSWFQVDVPGLSVLLQE